MKAKKKTILLAVLAILDCVFGGIIVSKSFTSTKHVNYSQLKTSANYMLAENVNDIGDNLVDKIDETEKINTAMQLASDISEVSTKQTNVMVSGQKIIAENAKIEAEKKTEAAKKAAEQAKANTYTQSNKGGALTKSKGVVYFNGHRETYYSQRVLPGKGLKIPGRHVASDGTIRDENNYIVVAADPSFIAKGTVIETSLGTAKVYDSGCAYGTVDIYTDW